MKKLDQTLVEYETYLHRKDDCGYYEQCLNKAAVRRWPSFSCMDCSEYKHENQLSLRLRRASSLAGEL